MAVERDEEFLQPAVVGESLARVWRVIAGAKPPQAGRDDPLAHAFDAAAQLASVVLGKADQRSDVEVSASQLAEMMARAFMRQEGRECVPLADMPPRVKVAWLAAARHAANLLDLAVEDSRQIPVHEERIQLWAAKQLVQMSATP